MYRLVSSTLSFCSFRFCETRWVDDRPVTDHAIEVWLSIVKCMTYWEKMSRSRRPQIKSYKRLVDCYPDSLVPAELHFFLLVGGMFESYLTFPNRCPHVLFMFDELSAIFKKLVGLIFKKDTTDNARSVASMLKKKWLQDSKN